MINPPLTSLLLTFFILSPQVSANDTAPAHPNVVPVGSQSMSIRQSRTLPKLGQTMDAVKQLLGDPKRTESIGKPVITRWFYPQHNLTIYFEDQRVLRSVLENLP